MSLANVQPLFTVLICCAIRKECLSSTNGNLSLACIFLSEFFHSATYNVKYIDLSFQFSFRLFLDGFTRGGSPKGFDDRSWTNYLDMINDQIVIFYIKLLY